MHGTLSQELMSAIQLAGISSNPNDLDMSKVQGNCPSKSSDNRCFPIKGGVTLYFSLANRRLQTNALTTITLSSDTIKTSMDSGTLNIVHPSIAGLRYLNDGSYPLQDIATAQATVKAKNNTFPLLIAFITVGATLLILFVILAGKHMNKKRSFHKRFFELSDEKTEVGSTFNKWDKYHDAISFELIDSPTSISSHAAISDKRRLDSYDISSESVLIKIDRRILDYERVWEDSSL